MPQLDGDGDTARLAASTERTLDAPAGQVCEYILDYCTTRPRILTDALYDYAVVEGATGSGIKARWELQATSKPVRDIVANMPQAVLDMFNGTNTGKKLVRA